MNRILAAAALAAALLPGRPALAESGAQKAVQTASDKLKTALDAYSKAPEGGKKAARHHVTAAVDSLLDFESLVKAAAGKHWADMDAAQQKRFGKALRGVMEANYLVKGKEAGDVDITKVKTEVTGEEEKDGKTVVKTKLTSGEDSAAVDYVLEKHGGHWRAVDVLTEQVSLVETYREQIQTLWPEKGFEGVAKALEKKQARLEKKLESEAKATGKAE